MSNIILALKLMLLLSLGFTSLRCGHSIPASYGPSDYLRDELKSYNIKNVDEGTLIILTDWREDKNGCRRLRDVSKGYYLYDHLGLKKKSMDQIIQILGEPSAIISTPQQEMVVRYITGANCKDVTQSVPDSLLLSVFDVYIHPITKVPISIVGRVF
jgi:hypothetical protein